MAFWCLVRKRCVSSRSRFPALLRPDHTRNQFFIIIIIIIIWLQHGALVHTKSNDNQRQKQRDKQYSYTRCVNILHISYLPVSSYAATTKHYYYLNSIRHGLSSQSAQSTTYGQCASGVCSAPASKRGYYLATSRPICVCVCAFHFLNDVIPKRQAGRVI